MCVQLTEGILLPKICVSVYVYMCVSVCVSVIICRALMEVVVFSHFSQVPVWLPDTTTPPPPAPEVRLLRPADWFNATSVT